MGRRHYDWPSLIDQLAKTPGVWRLALPNVPARTAKIVRLRQHPSLRRPDGRLEVDARNVWLDAGDKPRCDLFLRWVPTVVDSAAPNSEGGSDEPRP